MPAPQIRLTAPAADDVRAWLLAQPDAPPPYPAPGSTRATPTDGSRPLGVPADWNLDHRRVHLGDGQSVYDAARAALMTYAPLDIGWVWPVTTTTHPEPDARGAMLVRAFGVTWVNAWRIVYVDDDIARPDGGRRSAFAYGTLEAHAERGEERFVVEMRPDGAVWFDILAYSRPHHWLARLGGPVTRWVQKRFGPASVGRMRDVVGVVTGAVVAPLPSDIPLGALNVAYARYAQWPVYPYVPRFVLSRAKPALLIASAMLGAFGLMDAVDFFGRSAQRYAEMMAFYGFALLFIGLVDALMLALPLAAPHLLDREDQKVRMAQQVAYLVAPCFMFLAMIVGRHVDESPYLALLRGLPTLFIVYVVGSFARTALLPLFRGGPLRRRSIPDIVLRSAFALWFVGALWISVDAANLSPLGFPPLTVRLTAIHFHFAGFILPVIAATLARAYPSRLANTAAVIALLGVPSTVVGITAAQLGAPHWVEALFAVPMIAGALLVAAVHLGLAFGPHGLEWPMRVVALRAIVGLTLLGTMALALDYALRGWLPWAPTIPQMARWHGIGNAFGVATSGLLACWLDPATQPPVG